MIDLFTYETDNEFVSKFSENEVTVPDTISDKGIDIPGGLLDQSIFGPVKDYTCRCGELSGIIYEGIECKKCKVIVASKKLRRENFGFFKLNVDLINPLFEDIFITKILKITKKTSEKFYDPNEVFFTEDPKGGLKVKIDGKELIGKITFNSGFHSLGYGIESVKNLMMIYVPGFKVHKYFDERPELYSYLVTNPTTNILRLVPAAYREIYTVGKMKVVDTLNITYKSIMSSTKRIEFYKNSDNYHLNGKFWYEVLRLRSEVVGLYLGGNLKFKGTPIKDYPKILNKKSGLIRGQMLGKRSSFSARSVNTSVEPHLIDISEDEIILPFYMAKNLLRVHILRELATGHGINYEQSMDIIDDETDLIIDIMKNMDGQYYIYTSRAPALFKFSFMSFKMRINFDREDKTIKIHPLQNSMFNLDYDGDTMSVFLPITVQSQSEAEKLGAPSKNPFYDKNGSPIYEFSLEFIYGLYYMTNADHGSEVDEFTNESYYCDYKVVDGKKITYGSEVLHKLFSQYGFENYYKVGTVMNKKVIKNVTSELFKDHLDSFKDVLKLLGDITVASTRAFSESGLSIKFSDFVEVDKTKLRTTNKIIDYIMEEEKLIKKLEDTASPDNAFMSMFHSGTKGNHTQIKQVMISKGVLVDGNGDYLPPIRSSLAEGLKFDEFITTISAGRRGMVSKSLSTAKTGFFYYRLVKSMRDISIVEDDCKTDQGLEINLKDAEGRVLSDKLGKHTSGTLLTREIIEESLIFYENDCKVKVRSPIYCKSHDGVCKKCYGINISKNAPVKLKEKVGVTTGSTMSEIMSQAMLRNFHTAGSTDINRVDVYSKSSIDELDMTEMKDHTLIKIDGYEYLVQNEKLNVSKSTGIEVGDLVFSYDTSNSDITKQFYKLESILEVRTPKDASVIAPISGKLILLEVSNEVIHEMDKKLKVEIPRRVKYIKIKIEGSSEDKVLKIPYHKTFTVPFNSIVEKGDILTDGDLNYRTIKSYNSFDKVVSFMMKDLQDIYISQGSYVRSIHFELIVNHLIDILPNGDYRVEGITNKGLGRSFVQHLSLGWFKKALPDILDELSQIGVTNADKIILGNYE